MTQFKIIIRTCAGREQYVPYLKDALPDRSIWCFDDTKKGGMGCFVKALCMAGGQGVLHLEDDIWLTQNFEEKATAAIAANPEVPIQFFSMRGRDLVEGSRMERGGSFMMNQCHYIPAGMNEALASYSSEWMLRRPEHPHGYDTMMADFFRKHGVKYWLHVPSLVDHRIGKSVIDPRRASTNRQSLTFVEPYYPYEKTMEAAVDWKDGSKLKDGMLENPVVYSERIDLSALKIAIPTDEQLETVFKTGGYKLQTWNRSKDENGKIIAVNDPHWLAVRRGTPMHTDPRYPRYSHQLKIRVDPDIFVRGLDGVEMQLHTGTFYILDTHSPHQVFHKGKEGVWNVTASIDHNVVLNPQASLKRLIAYAQMTDILAGAPE